MKKKIEMNKATKSSIKICLAVMLSLAFTANLSAAPTTIFLDADAPATGSDLGTTPLPTPYGNITFVGEIQIMSGTYIDDDFITAGASGNAFNILDPGDTPGSQTAELLFDFDVVSIEFIYGGNWGDIYIEARDGLGVVLDSFYQGDTWDGEPAGPITLYGSGIRSLYWEDTVEGMDYAALDNITVTVATPCQNHNVWGYAWSENIGWISFIWRNTIAIQDCLIDYGVDICESDDSRPICSGETAGTVVGYAWSRGTTDDVGGIGWITFNPADLGGCPSGSCKAEVSLTTGEVSGWARAYRAIAPEGQTLGGWDGWIKLSGTWTDGVSLNSTPNPSEFEGWAWGSDVVGWISFSHLNCDPNDDGFSDGVDDCPAAGTPISNYKVMTDLNIAPVNTPPTAINFSVGILDCCFHTTGPYGRFEWEFFDPDPGADQIFYEMEVIEDSSYNSGEVNTAGSPGFPNFAYAPTKRFIFGQTFNWRLKVKDDQGADSGWIGPPQTPVLDAGPEWPWPGFDYEINQDPGSPIWTSCTNSSCDAISIEVGDVITLDNKTTGCPNDCNWQWDFGDGSFISPDFNPLAHTYTLEGNFTLTLNAKDKLDDSHYCILGLGVNVGVEQLPLPKWKEIAPF